MKKWIFSLALSFMFSPFTLAITVDEAVPKDDPCRQQEQLPPSLALDPEALRLLARGSIDPSQVESRDPLIKIKEELAENEILFDELSPKVQNTLTAIARSNRQEDQLVWQRIKGVLEAGINYFEMDPAKQRELLRGHY